MYVFLAMCRSHRDLFSFAFSAIPIFHFLNDLYIYIEFDRWGSLMLAPIRDRDGCCCVG